jgi:D-alanine-D-alanine ligase
MTSTKIDRRIEIVSSTEIGLSSMGREPRETVRAVLAKHYTDVRITIVNNISDLESLVERKPDLVFLGMSFIPMDTQMGFRDKNRIWISQYLDEHDIAYTGSNQPAHELELNKHLAKRRVLNSGIKTSPFNLIRQGNLSGLANMSLKYPVFIKPTDRGGGTGIDSNSVANNFNEMRLKVESITAGLQSDALIEEYLAGREFSVAVLRIEESQEFLLMPLELVAPLDNHGKRILSQQIKLADTETFLAVHDQTLRAQITSMALDVFRALRARDYGRIDIRLDGHGAPHFLEANLLPSLFNGYGNFPKACLLNMGLGYEPMILAIVRLAFARASNNYEKILEPTAYIDTALLPLKPVLENM